MQWVEGGNDKMNSEGFITMVGWGILIYLLLLFSMCGVAHIIYGFLGILGKDHECIIHRGGDSV